MNIEATYIILLLTDFLPRIIMAVLFASFVLGLSTRYLKDPLA